MAVGAKTPLDLRKRDSAVPVFAVQGQLAHDLDCRSPSRPPSKRPNKLHSASQSFCVPFATTEAVDRELRFDVVEASAGEHPHGGDAHYENHPQQGADD